MAAVIPRLQQANCAKLMRPKDDFDRVLGADVQGALERLPPRHHLNFWRFYLAALKAEVNDLPERPIDLAARERALMELGRRFNQNDVARLQRVVQDPRSAPDADACWAINAFTHNATQLSPDHAEALARLEALGQGSDTFNQGIAELREVLELVKRETGRDRLLAPIPFPVARLLGSLLQTVSLIGLTPPLTRDQVVMLQKDNVVSPGAEGLAALGVAHPTSMESIAPSYLYRYRVGGQFAPSPAH